MVGAGNDPNPRNTPEYGVVDESFKRRIDEIVGSDRSYWDFTDRYAFAYDGTLYEGQSIPEGVVLVKNAREVQGIMRICAERKVPLTARGGGSSLSGAPLCTVGGIILDFTLMDAILSVDPANSIVVVEPGVNCNALNEVLGKEGYFFPPDPGSSAIATLGGMVANNSGGVQALKYGVTQHYVLWIEVVLASGELVRFGSKVLKSASSMNLAGLMVGSEGQLGLVTQVGLKIVPLPQARKTGIFIFEDLTSACEAAVQVRVSGILPNMLELMDLTTTTQVLNYLGISPEETPRGNLVLVECDGRASAVEEEFDQVVRIMTEFHPLHTRISQDASDRDSIIQARKAALPALSRSAPTTCIEDFTVKISDIPHVIAAIQELNTQLAQKGVEVATFGHIGDGNLHPTFLFDSKDPKAKEGFQIGLDELYRSIVTPLEGSITGEHGIGRIKAPYLDLEHPSAVKIMREVKSLFDPDFLLNPGKGKGMGLEATFRSSSPNFTLFTKASTQALQCMRCGFCIRSCPAWLEFRSEQFSPRARINFIRGMLNKELKVDESLQKFFLACTLCGNCSVKCPAGIQTHEIFEKVRAFLHGQETTDSR